MFLSQMANGALVLCNPLRFLFCKYDKLPLKVLKNALIDFYDAVAISNAKHQLLEDMKIANFTEKLPHIPERRAGEMKTANEVDDIFAMISVLDERKLMDDLILIYRNMFLITLTTSRLFEGDMKMFMTMLEKISDKLTSHGSAITAIVNDLHKLQSKPVDPGKTANVHRQWTQQGVNNKTSRPPTGNGRCEVNVLVMSSLVLLLTHSSLDIGVYIETNFSRRGIFVRLIKRM